jgi:hypothetical protein
MAPSLRHFRSATPHKRPDPALLVDGQAAQNQAVESPGMFIKDAAGALVKIGPVHVGPTGPNSTPAGSAGNSVGEQWLDTSVVPAVARIWSGSQWVSVGGGSTVTTDDVPPAAPTDGALWWDSASTTLFVWYDDGDSAQWVQISSGTEGGGGGSASIATTPPAAPLPGDLWWDAVKTTLFIWYADGDSAQWVQASPPMPSPQVMLEPGMTETVSAMTARIEALESLLLAKGLMEPLADEPQPTEPALAEPAAVEPTWASMTKAEIAAYCQDTFAETLDTNKLKDELIAKAHELWLIAHS